MDGRDTISVTDPFLVFEGVTWSILPYFTSYLLKGSSFFVGYACYKHVFYLNRG